MYMCTYLKSPPRIEADQIVVLNYSQSRISLNKTVFLPTNPMDIYPCGFIVIGQ